MNTRAKTYVERFGDEALNPLKSGPEREALLKVLYYQWRTTAVPHSAEGLMDVVLHQFEDQAHGGIAVLVKDTVGKPRLQILHGIRKYPGPLAQPTPLSKKVFAYQGDVNPRGVATIVEVTQALFDTADEVVVYDDERHRNALEQNLSMEAVKPLEEGTEHTQKVKSRMAVFVPYDLMSFFLSNHFTARQAFLELDAHLTEPEFRKACEPLLEFLRVGSTLAEGDTVTNVHDKICKPFVLEAGLDMYMYQQVLCRDLPHFQNNNTETNNESMATMQATLEALSKLEIGRGSNNTATTPKEATLEEVFNEEGLALLKGLCHKDHEDELPSIYLRLARRKRNTNELAIIQSAFNRSQMALGLPGQAIVTPAVMLCIRQFQFHGLNKWDIASGVLPMSFVPDGAGTKEGIKRLNKDVLKQFGYQTMMSTSSQLISSTDANAMIKSKGFVPLKWAEADGQLEAYQAVLHALFGGAHPLFLAYRNGWRYYRCIYITLQTSFDEEKGALGPALLVYMFQSKVQNWLFEQAQNPAERLPAPDFTTKLREDFMQGQNLAWLPKVDKVPALRFLQKIPELVEKAKAGKLDGNGNPTKEPSGPPKKKKEGGANQSRVFNDNVDPRLREDNVMCQNIRKWKISKALKKMLDVRPMRADGKEMCIAFRGKGSCFSGCKNKEDHDKSSQEDKDTFHGKINVLRKSNFIPVNAPGPPESQNIPEAPCHRPKGRPTGKTLIHQPTAPTPRSRPATTKTVPRGILPQPQTDTQPPELLLNRNTTAVPSVKDDPPPVPPLAGVLPTSVPLHTSDILMPAPATPGTTATAHLTSSSAPSSPPELGTTKLHTNPKIEVNPSGHHHKHQYPRDRLDHHIERAVTRFLEADSYRTFIEQSRGKGDLDPQVGSLPHPASRLLARYQTEGTPVVMSPPPWDMNRKKMAAERGPHKSASNGIEFLREEFADMIDKEQWIVLPLQHVMGMSELRLSPLGLVPQRGRRDRMICDYSYFGVNADTNQQAAKESMQFGRALQRILYKIHHANKVHGPVYMSKIDLSDGFYRLWLRAEDTIHLAVLLPRREGEPPLVGVPLTNPMGWVESPPNFCACTETVADLANAGLGNRAEWEEARHTPHRLDQVSESPPQEEAPGVDASTPLTPNREATEPFWKPIAYWDIYVDDFLGLVQGNKWKRRTVKRILLRALDRVFRPLAEGDNPHRQEPALLKKMRKGDATWTTHKTVLGWDVNSLNKTITLPPHRVERLKEILESVKPKQKTIAVTDWHKIIRELRSMAMALPGALGLFSILQEAFRHMEKDRPRVRLSKAVHGFLADFKLLANNIARRPTRIAELIPDQYPATIGACDASGAGMGGVHFIPRTDGATEAILWRHRFPKWIQDRLVSFENPTGDITNSDLELAGSVAQNDILAQHARVAERTTLNLYDNTAAVYWQRKGATTTVGPAAYLLRLQALHQRNYCYVPTRDYIPGPENTMADILSRRWDLSNPALLSYFNTHFPQAQPWKMKQLGKRMYSSLMLAMSGRRCEQGFQQPIEQRRIDISGCGMSSVCQKTYHQTSKKTSCLGTPWTISKSSVPDIATEGSHPEGSPWALARWRTPCVQWGRASPYWGPRTQPKIRLEGQTTESGASCEHTRSKMLHPEESGQYQLQ